MGIDMRESNAAGNPHVSVNQRRASYGTGQEGSRPGAAAGLLIGGMVVR
jgi:hypothetical protein